MGSVDAHRQIPPEYEGVLRTYQVDLQDLKKKALALPGELSDTKVKASPRKESGKNPKIGKHARFVPQGRNTVAHSNNDAPQPRRQVPVVVSARGKLQCLRERAAAKSKPIRAVPSTSSSV